MTADLTARFGRNLVRLRHNAEMSQQELSVATGMHVTAIQKLEYGVSGPRLDSLIKLRGALGVSADELLDGLAWTPESYAEYGRFRIVGEGAP